MAKNRGAAKVGSSKGNTPTGGGAFKRLLPCGKGSHVYVVTAAAGTAHLPVGDRLVERINAEVGDDATVRERFLTELDALAAQYPSSKYGAVAEALRA